MPRQKKNPPFEPKLPKRELFHITSKSGWREIRKKGLKPATSADTREAFILTNADPECYDQYFSKKKSKRCKQQISELGREFQALPPVVFAANKESLLDRYQDWLTDPDTIVVKIVGAGLNNFEEDFVNELDGDFVSSQAIPVKYLRPLSKRKIQRMLTEERE